MDIVDIISVIKTRAEVDNVLVLLIQMRIKELEINYDKIAERALKKVVSVFDILNKDFSCADFVRD